MRIYNHLSPYMSVTFKGWSDKSKGLGFKVQCSNECVRQLILNAQLFLILSPPSPALIFTAIPNKDKINMNRINGLIFASEREGLTMAHWGKGLLSLLMTQTCLPRRGRQFSLLIELPHEWIGRGFWLDRCNKY